MKIFMRICMGHLFCLLRSSLNVWLVVEIARDDTDLLAVLILWLHQIISTTDGSMMTT